MSQKISKGRVHPVSTCIVDVVIIMTRNLGVPSLELTPTEPTTVPDAEPTTQVSPVPSPNMNTVRPVRCRGKVVRPGLVQSGQVPVSEPGAR